MWASLCVTAEKKEGEEKPREETVGLIARNPGDSLSLSLNDLKSGAIIIVLNDLEPHRALLGDPVAAEAAAESTEEQSAPDNKAAASA